MDVNLRRYWVTLSEPNPSRLGFGVTAFDEDDALAILRQAVFAGQSMPDVVELRVDVDVRDLDQSHVVPNMSPPNWRGVWYPQGLGATSH